MVVVVVVVVVLVDDAVVAAAIVAAGTLVETLGVEAVLSPPEHADIAVSSVAERVIAHRFREK